MSPVLTCTFMLSSASSSLPRYTSPSSVSTVTVWPSASCRTLIGTPMDMICNKLLTLPYYQYFYVPCFIIIVTTQVTTVNLLRTCKSITFYSQFFRKYKKIIQEISIVLSQYYSCKLSRHDKMIKTLHFFDIIMLRLIISE